MRLFIASPILLDDYPAFQEDFRDIFAGKWVEEANLHLTWSFLGDRNDKERIVVQMRSLARLEKEEEIAELGYFGRPPRVFFAKAEHRALYDKAREFREAGFDLYRFKPHITLCRIKTVHDYKLFKEKKREYKEKRLGIVLPEIALYKSTLTPKGAIHEKIYEVE